MVGWTSHYQRNQYMCIYVNLFRGKTWRGTLRIEVCMSYDHVKWGGVDRRIILDMRSSILPSLIGNINDTGSVCFRGWVGKWGIDARYQKSIEFIEVHSVWCLGKFLISLMTHAGSESLVILISCDLRESGNLVITWLLFQPLWGQWETCC